MNLIYPCYLTCNLKSCSLSQRCCKNHSCNILVLAPLCGGSMECLPKLLLDNLCKNQTILLLFFGLGPGYAPIPLGWSTILIKVMTVTHVMALVWPSMLLASHAVIIVPAHLLGHFGNARVDQLHLALAFSCFWFDSIGRLIILLCIILNVLTHEVKGSSTDGSGILHQVVLSL